MGSETTAPDNKVIESRMRIVQRWLLQKMAVPGAKDLPEAWIRAKSSLSLRSEPATGPEYVDLEFAHRFIRNHGQVAKMVRSLRRAVQPCQFKLASSYSPRSFASILLDHATNSLMGSIPWTPSWPIPIRPHHWPAQWRRLCESFALAIPRSEFVHGQRWKSRGKSFFAVSAKTCAPLECWSQTLPH